MAKINTLSRHVADLIAAGEVVERPASVVKELIENSIDAGGTQITVEIKNGGMSYIRVTDNGCGMAPDDAKTAFLRHATSKLSSAKDLEAIGTLGFRGEALAAISAVSKVELITKEPGTDAGTRVVVSGGKLISSEPIGCPDGTTFIVQDLFFNTPARLKFIKNDRSEGSAVSACVIRCALSHPEVSIKYIRDGKEECHTPGDGKTESCVYSLLGRDFASGMLKASSEIDKIKVTGYVSSPTAVRGNRTRQYFFVNGRFIRSATIQAALERSYANSLPTGKYPACVLHIEISYGAVDVNVHPTKTEVKFSDENKIFSAVYAAVSGALNNENRVDTADIPLSKSTASAVSSAPAYTAQKPSNQPASHIRPSGYVSGRSSIGNYSKNPYSGFKTSVAPVPERFGTSSVSDIAKGDDTIPYQTNFSLPRGEEPAPISEKVSTADDYTIIGECMNTYIIVQQGDTLILIDKHAAHERMIFDRLTKQAYEPMSQITLTPVICEMSHEDISILTDNAEELSALGFEIDLFGENAVAVRHLPADIDTGEVKSMLEEICSKLSVGDKSHMAQLRDDVLHTVACKAAIKAGRSTDPYEFTGIVNAVLSNEIKYCPHGRPVSISLTKSELDRRFRRI